MFAATRALEDPIFLPEAPETFRNEYNDVLAECRKMAAEFGLGDESFLDNRIKKRLHEILLAPDSVKAAEIGVRVWQGVQIHLILAAHRAGKLTKVSPQEIEPIED